MGKFDNYYLGLDMGTSSVGWAVTDENYNILKAKGKLMWGIRLFSEAETAEGRRVFRSSRRRLKRRKERIKILEMLFAKEITKVDPGFFQRLKESKYHIEDKSIEQPNTLFNDEDYKDKDYHNDFPTIYHLRKFLLEGNKPKDVRFLYLAIHHLFMHRGHFLFPDMSIEGVKEFGPVFKELQNYLYDELDLDFAWKSGKEDEVLEILKDRNMKKSDKEKELCKLVQFEDKKIDNQRKAIIGLFCGCKKKFSDIFLNDEYKEESINSFSFAESSFDEKRGDLEALLGDKIACVEYIKAIYDWAKLSDILQGENSISAAKVRSYEEHQQNLKDIKYLLGKYDKKAKNEFFRDENKKDNYIAYINNEITQEDINKKVKKLLENLKGVDNKDQKLINELAGNKNLKIIGKADNLLLFPKQVTSDNGVIPYQIHKVELEKILDNMKKYFPFLLEEKDGRSIIDKLISTFTFRIPYYVGPLNNHSDKAWIVKNRDEKIYPWNFKEIVNLGESSEKFIENLTNKCTYLPLEDVLPKSSLLYSKFEVLNEINNLKVSGEPISVELKQGIYNNLFKKYKKVTMKGLVTYLKSQGIEVTSNEITGIDEKIKSSLGAYIDFKKIFGDRIEEHSIKKMVEDCIRLITIYPGENKLLREKIKKEYGDLLTDEELKKILSLKYSGWGRLSYKFLQGIQAPNPETGEFRNIIQMLWETNHNLMELLSNKFMFMNEIEEENSKIEKSSEFTYENILGDTYFSPSVKRMIWQALLIVEEIKKVTKNNPKKIFIEMARENGTKGDRKESRKKNLLYLYNAIKGEKREWKKELEGRDELEFRSKRLYLYYTQMGKCMYSGEDIPLENLFNKNTYDIDHIYPRSKTKDDSMGNLVLVRKNINAKKTDEYPIKDDIRSKMGSFWKKLHNDKLIGDKKYERLTRSTEFTDDELSNFIARQLVETRQSTKAVADILKDRIPSSQIVYVKANLTSDFRRQFNILKSRDINDYHHAHDAYLNIVTGNVYNTRFTNNPLNFVKKNRGKYSLKTEVIFGSRKKDDREWTYNSKYEKIWNPNKMIPMINDYIYNKRPLFTRYSFEQHGGFFDQNILDKETCKKGQGYISVKASDIKLKDTSKYGGYGSISGTYFFLVEHTVKEERVRTIEILPLYLAKNIKENKEEGLVDYCKNQLSLVDPVIKVKKIKYNSLLKINGYPYHITGKANDRYRITGAVQLFLNKEEYLYLRKLYIYSESGRFEDDINKEKNIELYNTFIKKFKETIYSKKMSLISKKTLGTLFADEFNKFSKLTLENQVTVLTEIPKLLKCVNSGANLVLLGHSKLSGVNTVGKNINKLDHIKLINQSITGLYENVIDLKKV